VYNINIYILFENIKMPQTKEELIEIIKQKLKPIPIFMPWEKEQIIWSLDSKTEDELKLMYEEVLKIEDYVENNKEEVYQKLQVVNREIKTYYATKTKEVVKKIIEEAEKKDREQLPNLDDMLDL